MTVITDANIRDLLRSLSELLKCSEIIYEQSPLFARYLNNTLSFERKIMCVVVIKDWEDLSQLLKFANQYCLPVYPISTGNNWGYGCALPASDNCIIVDLSNMKKIISFNAGIVTIEPGVTQKLLYDYLNENGYEYLVPTTGAGPNCSLIGNILERGIGLAPINDHSSSIRSLHAILADGTIYTGSFPIECEQLDKNYPHTIGPNLASFIIQSNFCIVTQMSIQLAPKPEQCELATILLEDQDLNQTTCDFITRLHREVGRCHMSNVTLMCSERFSKFCNINRERIIDKLIQVKTAKAKWVLFFCLYANKDVITAYKKFIKKIAPHKITFVSTKKIIFLKNIFVKFRYFKSVKLSQWTHFRETALLAFSGYPTERGLQLVYEEPIRDSETSLNPANDQRGFYWCTLILPLTYSRLDLLRRKIEDILNKFSIPRYVSFTSFNDTVIMASIILYYDKHNYQAAQNCYQCYQDLINEACQLGAYPQRLSILSMPKNLNYINQIHWEIMQRIKNAIDPNHIIAPGRYEI